MIEGSTLECLLSSRTRHELYLSEKQLYKALRRLSEDVPLTELSVADQTSAMPAYSLCDGAGFLMCTQQ